MNYLELLKINFWNNSAQDYLIAFGALIGLIIVFKLFRVYLLEKMKSWAQKSRTDVDDEFIEILATIPVGLYQYIAFYIALHTLQIPQSIFRILDIILVIIVVYWATKAISLIIEYTLHKFANKGKQTKDKTTNYFGLVLVARIILWSTAFLVILSNLDVNISGLVASLGIGGIAIALAVQNILGDIFSSFSIYFDKPFEVGDYVMLGDHEGTIKKIGLKTTRIEALRGEEIVISNQELTNTRIRNFKRMKKRRIVFNFGLVYHTKAADLKRIPAIVEKIINKVELADFDGCYFREFSNSSLRFDAIYYINSAVYKDYLLTHEEINLAIHDTFEKEKIEMAFPTQTIHLHKS